MMQPAIHFSMWAGGADAAASGAAGADLASRIAPHRAIMRGVRESAAFGCAPAWGMNSYVSAEAVRREYERVCPCVYVCTIVCVCVWCASCK